MQNFLISNLILILLLISLCLGFVDGYKKGILKKIISFLSIIISINLTKTFTPKAVVLVKDYTNIESTLTEMFYRMFKKTNIFDNVDLGNINSIFNLDNMNDSIRVYINENLTNLFITILCSIFLFIFFILILKIIIKILDIVNIIPIVGQLNKILGGILGFAESYLVISIIFCLIRIISSIPVINELIVKNIQSSFILNYIYNNNLIYNFFS